MKGRKDTVNGLEKGEDKFMKEQDKRLQDLGVQISIYRKQKKMTQAQLAVEIGISRTHMSNIEALNMPTQISVDTLFKIADVLGIKWAFAIRLSAFGKILYESEQNRNVYFTN